MKNTITLKDLSQKIGVEYKGDPNTIIYGLKDIERLLTSDAELVDNYIYFIESPKYLKKYPQSTKFIVLTIKDLADKFDTALLIDKANIRLKFIDLLTYFSKPKEYIAEASSSNHTYIHSTAKIDSTAIIMPGAVIMQNVIVGANSKIYPNVVLEEGSSIGHDTILHANVVIGANCIIGNHCILYACTVIGADGFGYYDDPRDGIRYKLPHIGNVIIKDYVEIGASTSIDRATIESTVIGKHTKIDNQVQIGHNCQIGEYVYIAGSAGLAGSIRVDDYAIIAGAAGIADHVRIGKKSVVFALAGVPSDVEPNSIVLGSPCRPLMEHHRLQGFFTRLPQLFKRVDELEKNN